MTPPECRHPASSLLDWYVNGSLEGPEEAETAAHMRTCAICSHQVTELTGLVRALSVLENDEVGLSEENPRSGRRLLWMFQLAAAVIIVVASLLVVDRLGLFDSGPPAVRPATLLDLGEGPSRGIADRPGLVIGPGIEDVVITFRLAVPAFSPDTLFIRDPDGRMLVSEPITEVYDPASGYTRIFPAKVFSTDGEHVLVLSQTPLSGDHREFQYPFSVSTIAGPPSR